MHLRRGRDQHQLAQALRLRGGEGQPDRPAERVCQQEEWLGDRQPLQHLGEIPQKLFQRIGRTRLLGLIVAAQIGGDHPIVLAEIGDLVLPLLGIAPSTMNADDRAACGQFGRPNIDHTQPDRQRAGDSDGCAGKIHILLRRQGDKVTR